MPQQPQHYPPPREPVLLTADHSYPRLKPVKYNVSYMSAVNNSDSYLSKLSAHQRQQQPVELNNNQQHHPNGNSRNGNGNSANNGALFSAHYKMATARSSPKPQQQQQQQHQQQQQQQYYHTYNLGGGAHSSKTTSELLLDATHLHHYNSQSQSGEQPHKQPAPPKRAPVPPAGYSQRNSSSKQPQPPQQQQLQPAFRLVKPSGSAQPNSSSSKGGGKQYLTRWIPQPATTSQQQHSSNKPQHFIRRNTTQQQPPSPQSKEPGALIWTVEHAKPTVVVRKPRTRRLLRSLLCCFGAEKQRSDAADGSSPSDALPGNGHSSAQSPSSNAMQLTAPANGQAAPPLIYSPKSAEKLLLPPQRPSDTNKLCLVIDLDETLVHSSFKPVKNPDFVIPVEIDNVVHQVYVLKRPHVDEFLRQIGDKYECVLFTASLAKYADPVADLLDKNRNVFRSRLFREACVFHKGNYVKDLNRLGRDLKRVIIIDNSPASYAFHPDNAVPVTSWFDDMKDDELLGLLPILDRLSNIDNVYTYTREQPSDAMYHVVKPQYNNNNNTMPPPDSNSPIASVARPDR